MDIGDYVTEKGVILHAWGNHIADQIAASCGALLKVPAQVRVKDPTSARGKQLRKNYSSPVTQMTDLVGARFVVLTSVDLLPVRTFLESFAGWDASQARDPDEEIARDPTTFGYQSHHYEVRPRVPIDLGGNMVTQDICCEVQVRTLLQHAYAELTHDALYKPSQVVPSQSQRLVARSMALMETTDELLCNAIKAVRAANEPAHALQSKARDLTAGLGHAAPQNVLDLIADAFRDEIRPTSSREIQEFAEANSFIAGKLRDRLGRPGLFAFPDAALIAYWLTQVAEEDLVERWPLPSTVDDVKLVMSDMGLGF